MRARPFSTLESKSSISNGAVVASQYATVDTSSDSSSFRRREVELATVEERFRDSHLRKGPLTPVESKFRELFYDGPDDVDRKSILCGLHLTIPSQSTMADLSKFDGTGSEQSACLPRSSNRPDSRAKRVSQSSGHLHLKVPYNDCGKAKAKSKSISPKHSQRSGRFTRGFSSSKDGDETAEMWKRALRTKSVAISPRSSTSVQLSDSRSIIRRPVDSSQDHSPTCSEVPPQDEDTRVWQSLAKSNTVLEEWARQLKDQERRAKANTRALAFTSCDTPKNSSLPPTSWSRFSSHNREERNATAGPDDHVNPKDFAVKGVSVEGEVTWTTDKDDAGLFSRKSMVRSFSDRFTQPLNSRWSKLMRSRSTTPSKDKSMVGKRRSSLQASGDLEYPELELLPTSGGYKELRALEREIDEMKGFVGPDIRVSSDGEATRPSLTERMGNLAQHDGIFESTSNKNRCDGSNPMRRSSPQARRHQGTLIGGIRAHDTASANNLTHSAGQKCTIHFSRMTRRPFESSYSSFLSNGNRQLKIPLSPISSRTSMSTIRRASMAGQRENINLTIPIPRCKSWSGRDSIRRPSAFLLTTPVSP